ncbi:hypothetical protein ASPFODRAFT_42145, partial [Aspergillus luchuensis CBS 106.47]
MLSLARHFHKLLPSQYHPHKAWSWYAYLLSLSLFLVLAPVYFDTASLLIQA